MTGWAQGKRYDDLERDHEIARALTLACEEPGCGAKAGEICNNLRDHLPLLKQVVHLCRRQAGRELPPEVLGEQITPASAEPGEDVGGER